MTAAILENRELEYFVKDWRLIPDTGGKFEFEVNGQLLFSKKQLGRHATEGEIEGLFAQLVEDNKQANNIILS